MRLQGRRILVGVTGSIAAYKAAELVRRFQDEGAEVRVVMTANAMRFIAPLTFAALTRRPVLTDEFSREQEHLIGHIAASEGLDLAVVAPATANLAAKLAVGLADDALTTTILACSCPVIVAPAMNARMYANDAVQANLHTLRERGVTVVEPESGWQACGTVGAGRLADPSVIVEAAVRLLGQGRLAGTTVLVTAGPTRERIDAVRFISNPSTGRMGYAVAAAAKRQGAKVVLVTGPTELRAPDGVEKVPVTTAAEMHRAVLERFDGCGVLVMAAAVSDFRPAAPEQGKVKKVAAPLLLQLERTEDILAGLAARKGRRVMVGFAAETEDLVPNALKKLREKELDLIVANDVSRSDSGFAADMNAVTLIGRDGIVTEFPAETKSAVAERIIAAVLQILERSGQVP